MCHAQSINLQFLFRFIVSIRKSLRYCCTVSATLFTLKGVLENWSEHETRGIQFHPKHASGINGMTSVAFCASPVKSCGVQIIIPSITNIPSSSLKLAEVSRVPLIQFCFPQISCGHLCHIVSNCL